jgi:hypothetical protein
MEHQQNHQNGKDKPAQGRGNNGLEGALGGFTLVADNLILYGTIGFPLYFIQYLFGILDYFYGISFVSF